MRNNRTFLTPYIITAIIICTEIAISFNATLLPSIKTTFSSTELTAQLTLAIGLLAMGLSGLIYGGLADNYGRKPVLLTSIAVFTISSLLCASAPYIWIFFIARLFQGIGSGAGWVVGNACLNDVYTGKNYNKIMNYVHAIAGITPAISPVFATFFINTYNWRYSFLLLFLISLCVTIILYMYQPETLTKTHTSKNRRSIIRQYLSLRHSKQFVTYCAIKVIAVMLIFCEISTLSLVYIDNLNVPVNQYGLWLLPLFACYILSTLFSSKIHDKIARHKLLIGGFTLILISNAFILIYLDTTITPQIWALQLTKSFAYIGWGFIFGNATAFVVDAITGVAATASAAMISLEMLASSLGISFIGLFYNGTLIPLSIFTSTNCIVAILILIFFSNPHKLKD